MIQCPKCNSQNVNVSLAQTKAKTSTKGNGCLYSFGRIMLICCTCGLWLLVGKHKGTSTTNFEHTKTAVCQDCGHSWVVK